MKLTTFQKDKLVDTHAHLHMEDFDNDRTDVYERTRRLRFVLNVSTCMDDLHDTLVVCRELENVYAAVGIHPHNSAKVPKDYLDKIEDFVKGGNKVIAVGEIGLDYFRNLSPIDIQKKVFIEQLVIAKSLKKPVILHIRNAYEDTYKIIKDINIECGGIVHAFSSDENWAKEFVKIGFKIGIGGPVTYPKNDLLRNVVKIIGVENIVTETDSPYLPPQQYRGKRNEPVYVQHVYDQLQLLSGLEIDELCDVIWNNVKEILKFQVIDGVGCGND